MDWKPPSYLTGEPHAVELTERLRAADLNHPLEATLYLAVMVRRLAMAVEDLADERHEAQAEQMERIAGDIRQIKTAILKG